MRCSRAQYLYEDYVSALLPPETMERIDEHLVHCAACREFYETNDDLAQLICKGNEVAHPGDSYLTDLSSRILTQLDSGTFDAVEESSAPVFRSVPTGLRPFNRPLYWAGAAAAVVLIGLSLQRTTQQTPELHTASTLVSPPPEVIHLAPPALRNSGIREVSISGLPEQLHRVPGQDQNIYSKSGKQEQLEKAIEMERERNQERDSRSLILEMIVIPNGQPRSAQTPTVRPPSATPAVTIPASVQEEIFALDAQGTEAARAKIKDLVRNSASRKPGARNEDETKRLAEQWNLYLEAEKDLREERLKEAEKGFEAALKVRSNGLLGTRAAYRLAGIAFEQTANFGRAQVLYHQATTDTGRKALSAEEVQLSENRIEVLDHFATDGWKTLKQLHLLVHAPWSEVGVPLKQLLLSTATRKYAPDAARIIVERIERGDLAPVEVADAIVKSFKESMRPSESAAARAWVSLVIGDILWANLQSDEAPTYLRQAMELDPQGPIATIARNRLDQISKHLLRVGSAK